ncbi:hypothetical protein WCLP8_3940016 [uncultured Gammaproteobacteria bacterium]
MIFFGLFKTQAWRDRQNGLGMTEAVTWAIAVPSFSNETPLRCLNVVPPPGLPHRS